MKSAVPTFRTGGNRSRVLGKFGLLVVMISACALLAGAQTPGDQNDTPQSSTVRPQEPASGTNPVDLKSLPKNLFLDQKDFWTAPLHMSDKQWDWALPSILAGGLLIEADKTIENHVPTSKSTVSHAVTASNAGVAALTAAGAGLFLLGHIQSDDQKRETGILSGEAAIGAWWRQNYSNMRLDGSGHSSAPVQDVFSLAGTRFLLCMRRSVGRLPA